MAQLVEEIDRSFLLGRIIEKQGIIFKLNIEKAFDKINWDFPLSTLHMKFFPTKWINWIRACISSASYSILLDGKPRGFIQATLGIRQSGLYLHFYWFWLWTTFQD